MMTTPPPSIPRTSPARGAAFVYIASLTLTLLPNVCAFGGTVVAWGANSAGQSSVSADLTNGVGVAAGYYSSAVLRSDGTVAVWGQSYGNPTNVPPEATNIVAMVAGGFHILAQRNDGTIVAWGDLGACWWCPSSSQHSLVAMAAGGESFPSSGFNLAVDSRDELVNWGYNGGSPPAGLSNIVAVAGGQDHSLGLRQDGLVFAWGSNSHGQTSVPEGLSNVVAVAAGGDVSLALKGDGTVVQWGGPFYAPAGLSNIVAIAAGVYHALALKRDGTVISWGFNTYGQTDVPAGLSNVVAIAAGAYHSLVLVDTNPIHILQQPLNQIMASGDKVIFSVRSIGAPPFSYQWRFNGNPIVDQTNSWLLLPNIQAADQGNYEVVLSNSSETLVSSNAFLHVVASLGDALNAPDLVWTNANGDLPWFPETYLAHDGFAAATSGRVTSAQRSSLQTSVIGPGTLSFWWQNLPVYSPGYMIFLVNGMYQESTHLPQNGWKQETVYLPPGPVLLEWEVPFLPGVAYFTGLVDQVTFTPGPTPPLIITPPGSQVLPAGTNVSPSVVAGGTPPLSFQWFFNGNPVSTNTLSVDTISALYLTDLQSTNAGIYSVTVSNDYGVTNVSASLTVASSPPVIWFQPTNQQAVPGGNCAFSLTARGSYPMTYQWRFNDVDTVGATNSQLILFNVSSNNTGNYALEISNAYGFTVSSNAALTLVPSLLIGWGDNFFGQAMTPFTVSNVTLFGGGWNYTAALNGDGKIAFWGYPESGFFPPPTNSVRLATGMFHSLVLQSDGSVKSSSSLYPVPAGLSNVVDVAAGGNSFSLALRSDGTVVAWGADSQINIPPISNVVQIASGDYHSMALKSDGSVVAWADGFTGETNVPAGLADVVSIAAGWSHNLALKSDGTVVAWGWNIFGQTNVPVGLTNAIAVAAGRGHSMALTSDGSVVVWGNNDYGETNIPPAVANVVAISSGSDHCLALVNSGAPCIVRQPWCQTVLSGTTISLNVVATGRQSKTYYWQFNGTNILSTSDSTLILTNIQQTKAGGYQCIVSNAFGTVTSMPAQITVLNRPLQFDFSSSGLGLTTNGLVLNLTGLSARGPVLIYASTNLADWELVSSNQPAFGTLQFFDSTATNFPLRFYRALEQ